MTTRHLGATGNTDIRRNTFEFSVLSKSDWPGITNHYDPASATIMTRCHQYLQTGNFGTIKSARSTSSNWLNIRWVFQDQYFLSRRFGSWLKWIILHNISLQETNVSKLTLKLAYWPRLFKRSICIFCIDKVETYLLKKIYYEIMDIYISTRKWQGLKDDQVPVQENT